MLAPPQVLQRLSTLYVDTEDRIRLAGETECQKTVVLWLTRRLLDRLIPHFFQWLGRTGSGLAEEDCIDAFVRQGAVAQLEPEAPVCTDAQSANILVLSVDIKTFDKILILVLRDHQLAVQISFSSEQLRLWMSILRDAYISASWTLSAWPYRMKTETATLIPTVMTLH